MGTIPATRRARGERQEARLKLYAWFSLTHNAMLHMSAAERAELEDWDRSHVTGDGTLCTSDWPGWARHIDLPTFWPWPWKQGERPR